MQRKVIMAGVGILGAIFLAGLLGWLGAGAGQRTMLAPAVAAQAADFMNGVANANAAISDLPPRELFQHAATPAFPTAAARAPRLTTPTTIAGVIAVQTMSVEIARLDPASTMEPDTAASSDSSTDGSAIHSAANRDIATDGATAVPDAPGAGGATETPVPGMAAVTGAMAADAAAMPNAASSGASNASTLNGIPLAAVVYMPPEVSEHLHEIYARGQSLGRNPHAFAKVGDSTMAWPPLLAAFENHEPYQLGRYAALSQTLDYYAGSYGRTSAAVKKGMHTWSEFDAAWAPEEMCQPGEAPLACEFRLQNPSIAIIRLGANDVAAPDLYEANLRRIVEYFLDRGVIPVLGTKPDRLEGPDNTFNKTISRLASSYRIPLWNYDLIAATVPGRGLQSDGTHFVGIGSHDYTDSRTYASGDSLEDLTALMMLDAIRQELAAAE